MLFFLEDEPQVGTPIRQSLIATHLVLRLPDLIFTIYRVFARPIWYLQNFGSPYSLFTELLLALAFHLNCVCSLSPIFILVSKNDLERRSTLSIHFVLLGDAKVATPKKCYPNFFTLKTPDSFKPQTQPLFFKEPIQVKQVIWKSVKRYNYYLLSVVYFKQLLGAARTQKLVETL